MPWSDAPAITVVLVVAVLALVVVPLAQMLGASREAVNKQLRALAKEGRIAVEGHQIRVFKRVRT